MKQNTRFRHESLQDRESVKGLLKALTNGLSKGKIVLEDDDGTMVMEPKDLLNLKINASQDDEKHRLTLRITWTEDRDVPEKKNVKIGSK